MPKLILASASPRRRALLAEAGYDLDVRPADVPEDLPEESDDAPAVAERLAEAKARAVAATAEPGCWVLGADTVVVRGRRIVGKPADVGDARRILRDLSGTRHQVITGVALVQSGSGRCLVRHAVTHVRMRPLSDDEIRAYAAGGEALGKAGAYAVQETGDRFIEVIDGSFTNVVGLPMELLREMLLEIGWKGDAQR